MSKATAIVSLLVVACLFAFARWCSAALAANGFASALFPALVLVATIAGMGVGKSGRRVRPGKRSILRYAGPGLLVLLAPALMWALFGTSFQGLVTMLSTGGITLNSPNDVIVDSEGNVYIADTHNNQIVEVTAFGVASIVTFPGLSPALHNPNGVAIDGLGNLYVADSSNSRIVELSEGVASVIATGGLLSYPDGLVVDTAGDLFIADGANNDIVEVPAGGAAAVLTVTGVGAFAGPQGLAFDLSGNLYIADGGNNRIVDVAPGGAGTVLSITGGVTLNTPLGVAVDGLGNVYIADRQNNRIVIVPPGGVGDVLHTDGMTLVSPEGVAVGVSGVVYVADYNGIAEVQDSSVGFGHLTTGALSGTTLTLPITIAYNATFGSVQAFTQGTPGLDFTVASTTCVSGVTNDGACTVDVTYLPAAAGLRRGAMVVYNNATPPVAILTVPLYAFSDAPLASLSPDTGSVISTGGVTLSYPFQVALDGAGNMYVANDGGDDNGNVVKIPAGGGAATVVALGTPGGLSIQEVDGVAVDGAGNLFISDHQNNRILVVTPAGVVSIMSITGLSTGLSLPVALAFDGAGNLYIADYGNGRIVRVSTLVVAGSTSSGLGVVIGTGAFSFAEVTLTGMTVDAQGNIYIAAETDNSSSVIKVTAAGVASELSFPGITPALSNPQGVTVDAMGNVYVADGDDSITRIVRLTTAGVASVLGISILPAPTSLGGSGYGVTVDPYGNLYIPDISNNRVVFVNVSPSVLAFPSTDVGSSSAAQTTTVANLGDLPLIFATVPSYTVNFSEDTGDENLCALGTSLAAGTLCDVSVEFTPQSAGSLSTGIVVTNNSLNLPATTQTVAVSGTGIAVADTTAVAVSTNPTAANIGQPITVMAIVTDTTAGHSSTIPTGGVTFMDTVGSTTISLNGGAAVTLNGAGTAVLAGVTLSGAGVHTITANYVGVSGSFAASSNVTTLTVSKDTATLAGPVTQPVQVPIGTAGSVPVTVTGTYSVVAAPTGSLTYTVLNSLNVSVSSGTATLTAGETFATATVPLSSSLASGSYTVSMTYGGDSNYAASVAATSVAVVVGLITPTIDWTQPAPITYGATLSGILDASAVSGSTVVPGSFAYTATPQGGSAGAVTGTTVLGAASYTLAATFTPTDTTTYAPASATVSLTVAKAAPGVALMASVNPAVVAAPVTFTATVSSSAGTPSGSVSFYDGTTLVGSGTLALGVVAYTTSSLAVGAHSITAAYGGNSNFSARTSSVLTETVTVPATTATSTTLTASPNPLADGQPATLTAIVTPAPTGTPTGIVSFYSGTALLGTGTLNSSGVATFSTSSLVVGTDSLTAVYPGNASFAASTSSAVSETVNTAFTVSGPTTPVPVAPGGAATIDLTVPPLGGAFDGVVTLSATGLPPGATATFSPATVTPGTAGAPVVMTVQLATLTAGNSAGHIPARPNVPPLMPLALGFGVLGAVLGRKRIPRALALSLTLGVLGVGTLVVTGCGGGFANTPSTPAGNYTVTVTGTSGSLQASTTVTLVVE